MGLEIINWINTAIARAKTFFSMRGSRRRCHCRRRQGYARGGLMGGRGTGTSDKSGLAVARRAHHARARGAPTRRAAVAGGVARSGGNLRGVLDRMGHFALGGWLARPPLPRGGINGMSHVTIQFPGLPPIGGLRASSAVVDELRRAAAMAQVRSGGRKPIAV